MLLESHEKDTGTVGGGWDFSGVPDGGARYLRKAGFPAFTCRYGCGRFPPLCPLKPSYRAIFRS